MIHKEHIDTIDLKVCRKLNTELETLYWLKLEYGCQFLKEWIGEDFPEDVRTMEYLPEFWSWWKQIWYNNDRTYLARHKEPDFKSYKAWHDPKQVAYKPNSVIFESYHKLIKALSKKDYEANLESVNERSIF